MMQSFHRCFIVQQSYDDVSMIGQRLLSNNKHVTGMDSRVNHALARDRQRKVATRSNCRRIDQQFPKLVFGCEQRYPRRNRT